MTNTKQLASGASVTYYPWGLVHTAGPRYSGQDTEPKSSKTLAQVPDPEDEIL